MSAPGVTAATAIVLAGGRSSRFGRDKLAEPFAGRTVLEEAIAAVAPLARETIVVAAPDGLDGPRQVPAGVGVVRDERPFEGPLVGLLTGLRQATQPVVLLVGGDMPTLVETVLGALLAGLEDPMIDAVMLEHERRGRPLPGALRTEPALRAAERLVAGGERSLRALYGALVAAVIAESTWRALDPDGLTLRDVDTPADLG
ncbi:MAG: molybdenum cofactor guanylyltransferase [Candidatus Limnocylindrales bacterium]